MVSLFEIHTCVQFSVWLGGIIMLPESMSPRRWRGFCGDGAMDVAYSLPRAQIVFQIDCGCSDGSVVSNSMFALEGR